MILEDELKDQSVPLMTRLTDWIANPARMEGCSITETELAAVFGVSRTPLREAINRAHSIGLIRRERSRSIEIPPLSTDDMVQLSRTREELEGLIARQATERLVAGEISLSRLESINTQMSALATVGDTGVLLGVGVDFHARLCVLSGNAAASGLLAQLMVRLERYRQCVRSLEGRSTLIVSEHQTLLEAMHAGDAHGASAAARAHIARAREFYRAELFRHGLS
ncbi:DNA-binding GntR family transcriptional regulator [Sphingobium sp. B11D3B]|uniref:GntR family transcriptional regulator n=1 Tax=Sphingobium sp. B11D3B TaxID=2940575 RepID=UPI0022278C0A|nr:GntR family transcriptional regulator [Sphingobium sp. B11D3B]MCW2387201.1 DNA-binding GntR family transcriptional regulator [Sphingobium sp. B11D3B]